MLVVNRGNGARFAELRSMSLCYFDGGNTKGRAAENVFLEPVTQTGIPPQNTKNLLDRIPNKPAEQAVFRGFILRLSLQRRKAFRFRHTK